MHALDTHQGTGSHRRASVAIARVSGRLLAQAPLGMTDVALEDARGPKHALRITSAEHWDCTLPPGDIAMCEVSEP